MKFDFARSFRWKKYSFAERSALRWLKLAIGALLLMVACSDETAPRRGQIIVAMQTDMDIPKDLDHLRVVVLVNGALVHDRAYAIGPDIEDGENLLPATLAIAAEKVREERDEVDVRVLAQQGTDAITLGRLVTTIPKNRIATLYMPVQWLCKGELEANAEVRNTYDSTCQPLGGRERSCFAGTCKPVKIPEEDLPDFKWKDIYGGGDTPEEGVCFDTVPCFDDGSDLSRADVDSDCVFEIDVDDLDKLSIGLRLEGGGDGICDEDDERCYVPLDRHDLFGWRVLDQNKKTATIQIPEAACEKLDDGDIEQIRITTECIQKAPKVPTCGPWSSVEDKGDAPQGSGGAKNIIEPTGGTGGTGGTAGTGGSGGSGGGTAGTGGSGGTGGEGGAAPTGNGTLTGVVTDGPTGAPLEGVTVIAIDSDGNEFQTRTDVNGVYTFEDVAAGPVQVTYVLDGYVDTLGEFDVTDSEITQAIDAKLAPDPQTSDATGGLYGQAQDASTTAGVPGVTIVLRAGVNIKTGTAVAQTVTDSYGNYTFTGIPVGTYTLEATGTDFSANYQTVYVAEGAEPTYAPPVLLSATLAAGQLRIVLTWGASPSDLDSWLYLPAGAGASYVSFTSVGSLVATPYAALDVDDTSSYGPETITIAQTFPGTYRYVVNNYSGTPEIATSMARVQVFGESGLINEFSIPDTGTGLYWRVFEFDGETLEITPLNTIADVPICTDGSTECSSGCVDLTNDTVNCGACDNACDVSEFCYQGACTLG